MKDRLITVTATATEKVASDRAKITLLAEACGEYGQAAKSALALARGAEEKLCAAGAEVRIGGIRVSEQRDKEGKLCGYRVCHSVNVSIGLADGALGDALEYLAECGMVWQLSFGSDDTHGEELIARAVKNARAKAEVLAAAAGVRLGKLVHIDYAESGGGIMYARAAVQTPEEITLSETVVCGYAIED